jgi:hypothetical protein
MEFSFSLDTAVILEVLALWPMMLPVLLHLAIKGRRH